MGAPKPIAEDVEFIRRMAAAGWSWKQIADRSIFAVGTIERLAKRHNIPAAKGPPIDDTEVVKIERAVDNLRRRYPVFAESTAEDPAAIPLPYSPHTLFRVGGTEHVPVAALQSMVAQ